jgi:hypothetical protein
MITPSVKTATWTSVNDDPTNQKITLYGNVPPDNSWAGSYKFTCLLNDVLRAAAGDPPTTHIFTLNVI